ncbi:VCBS domain-containing protein [Bradyrhizobium sp. WSM1743]|uniref:VCBS domain-containing protein n=1 Tax=Bradyrhizobium sp. WSM1743 TaxID=318996 RepID=UPI000423FE69|nr:VCBS domain-containing protein [Bradyrhizobium sp. WSM1743]
MNYAGKFDAATSLNGEGSSAPAYVHTDSFAAKPFIAKAHGHVPDGAFVVPDPNLIFNGEFKRAGLDLVLSHEGHEFVVHDYFRGDKRAAIASPDGAHLTGDIVNALTGHVQVAQAAPGAAAAQVIGHVTKLSGSATAIRNGVSVILNNGDNVEKGDVVSTGADSTLGITFIDGTVFGLSSNARMVLNEMVYDPNGSSNSSLLSLVAGTITFVAGETAKHGDMKVDTPVATMGIRGTAVLTQINFVVPAGGGDPQPQASFQVLVEPNGTTGSYILFDKITLLPIATVNQAGQMIQISGGNVSISNALMSPEIQKLITDVFTLKFTDNNTNTKLTTNFTDTITPFSQDLVFKSGSGPVVIATFVNLNPQGQDNPGNSTPTAVRIPGQPTAQSFDLGGNVKTAFALTERADTTGDTHADTVSGLIRFVDQNLGDRPTVSVSLAEAPNYVYKNAGQQDVTGSLTALQKQDIAATQIQISVVADAANNNNGSAIWTYTIPDKVFDFLAAGETLTLTYMVRVDTNFVVSPESKFIPITITITGTNDKPTVATSGGTVIEKVGTGNEALDSITGTVTFTDVDLTDRPIVSAALSSTQPFKYLDAEGNDITATLTPEQRAAIAAVEVPLTVVQGAGNGNNGSATWTYSVPDHLFDFLAEGETLTLNYVVQVDDGHGGVVSTPITVSINGADVNVEGTNDVPTIVEDDTTPAGAVTEDTAATLAANGTITFNDPDLTDTHSASFVLKSTNSSAHLPGFGDGTSHIGTFALEPVSESPGVSSRGSVGWTFTLDNNDPVLQSLAKGQTITQVYTVTIDDHHGGTVTKDVTVTITGTNDAPTITSDADAATGSVTEDAGATLSSGGTLAIQDLDLIDTHTAQTVLKWATSSAHLPGFDGNTPLGTFTIDPSVTESNSDTSNGATLGWHFTLDNSNPVLQSLAEGQTITQVYTVTFTDNNGAQVSQDVTVTIVGTNDAPTITSDAAAASGSVTEDTCATLSIDGTLAIQDLDLIDTHTAQAVFKSATSSAHLPGFDDDTPLGTFTIDPSVHEFNTDTDNGATLGWHFSLDNSNAVLQSLAEGQTITQVYTVTFTDDHGAQVSQDVTVTINGANDAPTITSDAADAAGAVTEDACATLSIDGTLAIQDLDLIDTHTAQAVFGSSTSSAHLPGFDDDTPLGTFTIDPSVHEFNNDTDNGATLGWHFSLDNSNAVLQSLAEGQTITQVYTVTFTDNHGAQVSQDVTVTINGANDAPTITSDADAATGAVTEDEGSSLTTGGTLAIQDLDLIDTHTAEWSFKSSSVSMDLPGFGTGSHIGTFSIDSSVTESGSDTSNGATLGWHFTLDNDDPVLQSLAEGQIITQVYTVTFDDHHGGKVSQDVTVTITGTNDAPAASYVTSDYMNFDGQTIAVGEVPTVATDDVTLDGWVNWNGAANAGHGQILFYNGNTSTTGFGLLGTVNADGTMELQILAGGRQIADTGVALTASQWHNIALTRENDTFKLYLDGHLEYSQSWTINPIDGSPSNPSASYMMIGAASDSGAAGFGAEGFYGAIADVSVWTTALTQAQIQSIDFTGLTGNEANLAAYYQLSDGSGTTASNAVNTAKSLAIEGDADWASGTSGPGSAIADLMETNAGQLSHGALAVSDVDAIDHVTVSVSQLQVSLDGIAQTGNVGGLSHEALLNYLAVPSGDILNGTATHTQFTWTFNSQGQAFDFLAAGQTLSLQYTIVPSDAHGAGTSAVVTINIAGSNDAPTLDHATLASVAGNDSDPSGAAISSLFADKFHDADTGATFKAVAVTSDAATAGQGVWQYELAGTDQWVDIGSVSDTTALVLSPDTLIRFVPANGFSGTPGALGVHALDDTYTGAITTDLSIATIDLSVTGTGGKTPVSQDLTTIGTEVIAPADGPVINTESFQVEHIIENNSDIITDLMVAGSATHDFTVAVSTAHPDLSQVDFYPASGTLDEINLGFETGAVYNPTGASSDPQAQPPDTDQITLTVTDQTTGLFDTVHFIFNEAGDTCQGVTLEGTSGKDVIFATDTNDTLTGGAAKDQFVFAPGLMYDDNGQPVTDFSHTITDFTVGLDKIDLRQFSDVSSMSSLAISQQQNGDTLITWNQEITLQSGPIQEHESLLLKNVIAANLQASDFIFGTHVT